MPSNSPKKSREPKPPHSTAIVIAAYNEEERLPAVISEIKKAGWPWVVVVDDGSRDGTGAAAKRAGADVILQRPNQGQGAALRTGIQHAIKKGAERVVMLLEEGMSRPLPGTRTAIPEPQ